MVMDYLSIALSELGSISERRTYKLINGERDLPPYLIKNPGLESGFMIAQYTAASIASQNKHLANPASTDSLVSSMGQEDHVSMAANAGTKAYRLIQNVYRLLAIELMVGAKALEFRFPLQPGSHTQDLYTSYRKVVSSMEHDRILHDDLIKSEDFLRSRV
jgi:histidine ammonia-lyase